MIRIDDNNSNESCNLLFSCKLVQISRTSPRERPPSCLSSERPSVHQRFVFCFAVKQIRNLSYFTTNAPVHEEFTGRRPYVGMFEETSATNFAHETLSSVRERREDTTMELLQMMLAVGITISAVKIQ